MRWRIEKEVIVGKGQFECGNKKCNEKENLRSWEVNFGYVEHGEKKNALVKLSKYKIIFKHLWKTIIEYIFKQTRAVSWLFKEIELSIAKAWNHQEQIIETFG